VSLTIERSKKMPRDSGRGNNIRDVRLNEGAIKKGGVNPRPSVPRPSQPPKAQGPGQAPSNTGQTPSNSGAGGR